MYREAKEDLHALRIPITGRSGRWLLNLIDRVKVDEVTHRAVVADGWYRNIPEFHQGVDDRGESYAVGVYSDTQVFLESPVFVQPTLKKNPLACKLLCYVSFQTYKRACKKSLFELLNICYLKTTARW